jgi:fused signal recognition particle receptor
VFDLLKKRISGFVDKISGKAEKEGEKPEQAPQTKEEKPVSVEKTKEAAQKQPPKTEEGLPPEIPKTKAEEKKPPKEKAIPKAAKPKKEEAAKKKEKAAPEKAPQKEDGAQKPAKKKEAPKKEAEKEKPPEGPAKKKEEPSPKPKEAPKARKVQEEPRERKRGFLERVFGGEKKEEPPEPAPKKEEIASLEEAKEPPKKEELKEKAPNTPLKKEAGQQKKEGAPPPPAKAEISKEKAQKKEEELRKKVKKGLLASVSETIRGESEIKGEEVVELLDELELGMLESDVALSVAEEIKEELRKRIVGSKVKRGQTAIFVRDSLREILLGMFKETPGFEISERLGAEGKPHKIMVVGPNGAGKTTTIAKIVNLLKNQGHSVCVAASDTFRAAAVEQLVHHGGKLGISVIHGAYGSDPTSIAFDALNHAKANGIDIVIIDTAGRQDTNVNLINQLKKMDRVIKPELKIYVGESIAGNAMVEQISTFNSDIGLDGVVLTKLDCDPKGGTVISVSRVARLPILYVGTGQGYGDMRKFEAEEIVEEILS